MAAPGGLQPRVGATRLFAERSPGETRSERIATSQSADENVRWSMDI
jgi:hypothetical protein